MDEDNVIELSCRRCKQDLGAKLVLHRFNLAGEFLGTSVVPKDNGATF